MMLLGAVASAMVTIAGIALLVAYAAGVLPERRGAAASHGRLARAMSWLTHLERKTVLQIVGGVALGVVLMYLMRWPLLLIIVPAGVIGLPKLLSEPPQDQIKLLEALDRWVRGMLSILSTGKSITDALRHSVRQAPPLLAGELALLVRRLDDRWTPAQALLAMADALGSPDADAVLASLILSSSRGGTGASVTLHALADSIQERLRALREVEAERSKPRVVVRQVTLITVVVLVGFMVLSPGYFAPYGTPLGQVILATLLTLYVAAIWGLRRITLPRPRGRILRGERA